MPEPTHSPYNFVPVPKEQPERSGYPGLNRIGKDSVSGVLTCELEVLTRLFTADHQRARPWAEREDRRIFPFLRDSNNNPILQATTLKGMIRAVFEAAFSSCLPLAAAKGSVKKGRDQKVPYRMVLPEAFAHNACDRADRLCPACRLFGITQGDEVHAQGRVFFSDARLTSGELQQEEIKLAELSTPKPYHYEFYSENGQEGGRIRGRKLYYHHDPAKQTPVDTLSKRANAISEFAPAGSCFTFTMRFENLSPTELKQLIACLILDGQHAHKLGMAKPLGYGSCRIKVLEKSFVDEGGNRYKTFRSQESTFKVSDWMFKDPWLKGDLEEILRWNPQEARRIGYLPYGGYQGKRIGKHGQYESASSGPPRRFQEPEPPPAQKPTGTFASVPPLAAPPKPGPAKPRTRATLEVVKYEDGVYTLRDPETGQEDIKFRGSGVRWEVGGPAKVRIIETTRDGRIKKIGP